MALVVIDYKDGINFTGLTSGSQTFKLLGGKYQFTAVDTGSINVSLSVLGPDGSTYIAVIAAGTTAWDALDLAPGDYEISIGTGTSLSASVIRIPYRGA